MSSLGSFTEEQVISSLKRLADLGYAGAEALPCHNGVYKIHICVYGTFLHHVPDVNEFVRAYFWELAMNCE